MIWRGFDSIVRRQCRLLFLGLVFNMGVGSMVAAQGLDEVSLSFEAASARLDRVSDALAAAHAQVGQKRQLAEATRSLRLPEISLDVREIKYQKTGEFALGPLAPAFAPLGVPPVLPIDQGGWRFRPTVNVLVPLYTGGRIPAARKAAESAVEQAEAERLAESQSQTLQLVQLYFGQQLAAQALSVRTEVLDGLRRHVEDAIKLEKGGLATRAQRLQATVAHDQAARDLQKADSDLATLRQTLSSLLRHEETVRTTSPLFVISTPLEPVSEFRASAVQRHPSLLKLRALVDQAGQGVRVQAASLKPQLFLFGQKDLRRQDALMTDPDWVVGIGLKYTFLSGSDRPRQIGAAREQLRQAEAGLREAEHQVSIGVTKAWNQLETARQQFLLLDSSIRQAEENLRLQELSFREGQSTSLDVIDARTRLGASFIERAQAAYQYDVALAQLLEVSGQMSRYADYMKRADKVIMP
ncbi:MAG: TolC family protein [Lautropia sp.]|nr:TolC family protein [Lautropia sp.]